MTALLFLKRTSTFLLSQEETQEDQAETGKIAKVLTNCGPEKFKSLSNGTAG